MHWPTQCMWMCPKLLYWHRCAQARDEKKIGALKTHLNKANDLHEMLKWRNLNHSTLVSALSIGAQGKIIWGESGRLYCN